MANSLEVNYAHKSVAELTANPKNARTHSEPQIKKIAKSIKELGFLSPLVIDGQGMLVAGHGRLLAAKKLKLKTVPCVVADHLSEAQLRAFMLADNRIQQDAGWDEDMLKIELNELSSMDFDLSLTGFEVEEVGSFVRKKPEAGTDSPPPEPQETAISQPGDVWVLGPHRIMCGSALKPEDVEKLTKGETLDLHFTDPPYELQTAGGGILKCSRSMKQVKANGVDTFDPSVLAMHCKTNIFCHNKPLIKKYIELAERESLPYDLCFYKKENVAPNYGGHMMTDVEYIALIGQQDPNKGFEKEMYSKCFTGSKDADNELSYSKPVELCEKFILLYSDKSVLDLFGGSGSTLIAAEKNDRACYTMEINPIFADVIVRRLQAYTGRSATLESSGQAFDEKELEAA